MTDDNRNGALEALGEMAKEVAKHTALGFARLIGILLASGIAGTVLGAGVCLWYGAPMVLSLAGGVLGIALALVVLYARFDAW